MRMYARTKVVVVSGVMALALTVNVSGQAVEELPAARQVIDDSGFAGTVLIYDVAGKRYQAGHAGRIDRRLLPASTFKILNSLIALETGIVAGGQTILKWDGKVRERPEINKDLDLQAAFRVSAVPHFQELARRIGAERMQRFVDAVGYGNRDISGGIDQFWLSGGLRISPREQVEFLTRLQRGELPFSTAAMDTVKAMMVNEQTATQVIRAKTGWTVLPQNENVGWWVGWVEREGRVHMFATALEAKAPNDTFGPARVGVTRDVLTRIGVLAPVQ